MAPSRVATCTQVSKRFSSDIKPSNDGQQRNEATILTLPYCSSTWPNGRDKQGGMEFASYNTKGKGHEGSAYPLAPTAYFTLLISRHAAVACTGTSSATQPVATPAAFACRQEKWWPVQASKRGLIRHTHAPCTRQVLRCHHPSTRTVRWHTPPALGKSAPHGKTPQCSVQ